MKKLCLVFLMIIVLLSMIFSACGQKSTPAATGPAPAPTTSVKPIEIRWLYDNTGAPKPDDNFWPFYDGFRKAVIEKTNGRVKFVDLIGAIAGPEFYDQLLAGTGDIDHQVIITNPGRFPALEIAVVADLFTVCNRPSQVVNTMYNEFPEIQKQFADVKVLAMFCTPPAPETYGGIGFVTKDKMINTLEACKGVKMGQYGEWSTKVTAALGFVPVAVPPWEVYEALQKGLVDGSFCDISFLSNNNVGELAKYWCGVSILFCPFWLAMNKDAWNKLPPDVQKAMEEAAKAVPDAVDWGEMVYNDKQLKTWPKVQNVKVAPEEQAKWKAAQDPIQQAVYQRCLTRKALTAKKSLTG